MWYHLLIVWYKQILPQSLCSRYGLAIGAAVAPFVRVLVWICFPIAYPIAKVLTIFLTLQLLLQDEFSSVHVLTFALSVSAS